MSTEQGYYSNDYCGSLSEFGTQFIGHNSGAGFLRQEFSGSVDYCGQYPFVCVKSWDEILFDLEDMKKEGGISAVFVTDPFFEKDVPISLGRLNIARKFKRHFIVNLDKDLDRKLSGKKRYTVRKASESQKVRIFKGKREYAPVFWELYSELIRRHNIQGIQRLSEKAIGAQLEVEGAVVVEASTQGRIVGAMIWYIVGDKAYSHLHAQSAEGYTLHTNFALYYKMLRYLQDAGIKYANLGGVPGHEDSKGNGLAHFKSIWSDEARYSWLCGEILDRVGYERLTIGLDVNSDNFFPAYRF
ncbi:GNAT family N-acetyltransferase [uncultured Pseudodesulfovibrio sp.]|uniref:GNAT family N-acetyltransferase n=1 Tax=uncultured Pseudodesulfovibrio sp. TaxID=2035858 RepID=UPI0029C8A36C|nr:GNAT family N-acetyltransferase [uncultured Pseudodesulfovibrio sp.]